MRRFLVQVALFWLLQAGLFAGLYVTSLFRSDEYLAASLDKENRLAKLPGPRVVFVGGSNLAFGLDSAVIERCTGRRSVNMGLYAALGVPFMLDEARAGLRPGDVVVLALEYHAYDHVPHLTGEIMDWMPLLRVNPLAARFAPDCAFRQLPQSAGGGLGVLGQVVRDALWPDQFDHDYARHQFNEAGDVQSQRERRPAMEPVRQLGVSYKPEVIARTAALLEQFVGECRQRGIEVYLSMPVFPHPHYQEQADVIEAIQSDLGRRVSAPFLVTGQEATLPYDRFYDTPYHLTTRGTAERSEWLGRRLAQVLDRPRTLDPTPSTAPSVRDPLLSIPGKP
jgi:hypothetical protein